MEMLRLYSVYLDDTEWLEYCQAIETTCREFGELTLISAGTCNVTEMDLPYYCYLQPSIQFISYDEDQYVIGVRANPTAPRVFPLTSEKDACHPW
jgi:hypothetical protein